MRPGGISDDGAWAGARDQEGMNRGSACADGFQNSAQRTIVDLQHLLIVSKLVSLECVYTGERTAKVITLDEERPDSNL